MRVLLLEHAPLCAFDFIAALEANGHEVIGPAGRVSEGNRLLDRYKVDLALIDLHLGVDHGLDLVPRATAAGVNCIAVTGYPLEAIEAKNVLFGCMPKPVAGDQLAEMVDWFEERCTGLLAPPPSTFMLFGEVVPLPRLTQRGLHGRRRTRLPPMPKRIPRSYH